jgi:hypothetical protein
MSTSEELDRSIEKAASFQSMTVEGETVAHQNIKSLMEVRNELKREEEIESGRRRTLAQFDLSQQNF